MVELAGEYSEQACTAHITSSDVSGVRKGCEEQGTPIESCSGITLNLAWLTKSVGSLRETMLWEASDFNAR